MFDRITVEEFAGMLRDNKPRESWQILNKPLNHLYGNFQAIVTSHSALIDNDIPWHADCRTLFSTDEPNQRMAVVEDYDASMLTDEQLGAMVRKGLDIAYAHQVLHWTKLLVAKPFDRVDERFTLAGFRRITRSSRLMCDLINGYNSEFSQLCTAFDLLWNCQHAEGGWIYCLNDQQGHYKIGRTKYLDDRIKKLATLPPFPVITEAAYQVINAPAHEKALHERFQTCRLRGEWFQLSEKDLEFIKYQAGI